MNTNPPKILAWPVEQGIGQTHQTSFDCLISAGCSFTASTEWFDGPASWPGYLRDRCGIPRAIDMSFPGVGNRFIADSVHTALNLLQEFKVVKPLVVVMWSGLDRLEVLHAPDKTASTPQLDGTVYSRLQPNSDKKKTTLQSRDLFFSTQKYLEEKSVAFVFTSYANYLFPPFIPKRDTTNHFQDFLNHRDIVSLQSLPWIPRKPMDFLYEWSFRNDWLDAPDYYHPPIEANRLWTEKVLLPGLVDMGLVREIA